MIRIIVIDVTTELFEKQNFVITCPLNKGNAIKRFNFSVFHLIFEVPFDYGFIFFVKELFYIPLKNGTTSIPFIKPMFYFRGSVIFRPPTFNINGII